MIERAIPSREGDDYVWTWETLRLALTVAEVRESHGDVYAEVTAWDLGDDGERHHILGPVRQNLLGPRARTDLAKMLATRDTQERGMPAWERIVEQAFVLTLRAVRMGEPVIVLNGTVNQGEVLQARPYLVDPILAAGETTMLYADGAGGKSYLALFMALILGSGQPLAGGKIAPGQQERIRTLYLDWETNQRAVDRRWSRVCAGLGVERPPLHYLHMTRPLASEGPRIRKLVSETRADFVIVDSIGFASEADMNAAEAATRLFGVCNSLERTVLLLHHMSKDSARQGKGAAESYGTIYFKLATRNSWEMRSDEIGPDDKLLALWQRKTNEGPLRREPIGLRMHFEGDNGPVTLAAGDVRASPTLDERRPLGDRLKDLLSAQGALPITEILDGLGLEEDRRDYLKVLLNRLKNRGDVVQVAGDRWGRAAAE